MNALVKGCVVAALLAATAVRTPFVALADPGRQAVGATADAQPMGTLKGRVIDEGGRPVEGATIWCYAIDPALQGSGNLVGTSSTTGEFEISGVPPGVFEVWVRSLPHVQVDPPTRLQARAGETLTIRLARGAVITGKVVDDEGRPLTGIRVEAERLRGNDRAKSEVDDYFVLGGITDDRGVYRLWNMREGVYRVSASARNYASRPPQYLSNRVKSYYPGTSRATASEVSVRFGDEVTNIDIILRDDTGHVVSGTVGALGSGQMPRRVTVILYVASSVQVIDSDQVDSTSTASSFEFPSVEDGDYELAAVGADESEQALTSLRMKLRVRRADVTGLRLELQATSRLTGRVELRPPSNDSDCKVAKSERPLPTGTGAITVVARRVEEPYFKPLRVGVGEDSSFTLRNLAGTHYRLWLDIDDQDLFLVRHDRLDGRVSAKSGGDSEGLGSGTPDGSAIARDGVKVARGTTVDNLRFVVARGAARVRGRIAPAKEGEALPSRARVCLVPADPKQKDDVIHYYEVEVERDGAFDVRNVAPGEYFVATRVFPNDDRPDAEIFPASWDTKERAALRAAAEKLGIRVTLSPCQRLESAVVTLAPAPQ